MAQAKRPPAPEQLALRSLRAQAREVEALCRKAAGRLTPQVGHRLRVGERRLRVLLELHQAALRTPTASLSTRLARLDRELGRLRDLDTVAAHLRGIDGHDRLWRVIAARRRARAAAVQAILRGMGAWRTSFVARAAAPGASLGVRLPRFYDAYRSAARRAIGNPSEAGIHGARIALRRLIYVAAEAHPVAPKPSARFVDRFGGLLKLLSRHQDLLCVRSIVEGVAVDDTSGLDAADRFRAGRLAAKLQRRQRRLRPTILKGLAKPHRKAWRRLHAALRPA